MISYEEISDSKAHNILKIIESGFTINLEDVRNKIEDMKSSMIIETHKKNFSNVWQGSNGRFYTYLPDEEKKGGRKLIAKTTEKAVEISILCYYRKLEQDLKANNITLKDFYSEWIEYKELHSGKSSYMNKIHCDWKKYYLEENDMIQIPLKELTSLVLDEWAHKLIKKYRLTKTQYYNMTVIVRQALDYAVSLNILDENPFREVKVNHKLFLPTKKKPDASQVFLMEEQPLIENEAIADFEEKESPAALGIVLCFQIGARIGEIAALKWSDIDEVQDGYIHIQRMEVRTYCKTDSGDYKTASYEVVEHTKSEAGNRNTYLTNKAREILKRLKNWRDEMGYQKSDYIFLDQYGQRIHSKSFDTRLRKYCRHLDISEKSMHKIRKTYISALLDHNININVIRSQVGHEDERTTYRSYCFNRKSDRQTQAEFEKALS
jgi:integrase